METATALGMILAVFSLVMDVTDNNGIWICKTFGITDQGRCNHLFSAFQSVTREWFAHPSDVTKDIGVETKIVLCDIEMTLQQDVSHQSTSIS